MDEGSDLPVVDGSVLVFMGFTKHLRHVPRLLNMSQRNSRF
jgi:hypothetical protein